MNWLLFLVGVFVVALVVHLAEPTLERFAEDCDRRLGR